MYVVTLVINCATSAFENDYWNIQDRISCGNVTLLSLAEKSLTAPNNRDDFSANFALFDLIFSESTVTFNAKFLTILLRAKHHNVIEQVFDFYKYQYSPPGLAKLLFRLCHYQVGLILHLKLEYSGNGNNWRLTGLEKATDLFEFSPFISRNIARHKTFRQSLWIQDTIGVTVSVLQST